MKKDIYSRFNNEADQSLCKVCITYLARLDILSEPGHYHIPTRRPMTVYFAISSRTLREKSAPPRKSDSAPVDATLSRVAGSVSDPAMASDQRAKMASPFRHPGPDHGRPR
jgi:hypothetical protein